MTQARILIVEDDAIVARNIELRLKDLGYAAVVALSSEEALQRAAEVKPDLVLMDIQLPGEIDGIAAAGQLRTRFNVPVVFLTAYADESTLQRAKIAQPFGYILKPFEVADLRIAIELALSKHDFDNRLREREEWLNTTLQSIGDGVVTADAARRVTSMNRVAELLTGWSQAESVGLDLSRICQLVDANTQTAVARPAAWLLAAQPIERQTGRGRLIDRAGRQIPIEYTAAPLQNDLHEVSGVVVVLRDITQNRRAEQIQAAIYEISEAANSAQNLDALFHSIHRIMGTLMEAGNFYIALYDAAADLISFPYWIDERDPRPAPRRFARGLTEYVIRTGEPLLASPAVLEELVRTGEVVRIGSLSLDWVGVPLKIGEKITGVLAVQSYAGVRYSEKERDILVFVSAQVAMVIARKQSEEALRDSEERYRLLIENQGEGISFIDPDEHFTFANPATHEIFGVPSGRLIGRALTEFLEPEFIPLLLSETERRRDGQVSTYELGFRRADHERRRLLVTARPRFDTAGQFAGAFVVLRDITERKQAEEDLRQARNDLERRNLQLTQILDIGNSLRLNLNLDSAIQQIVQAAHHALGFGTVALNWLERESSLTYIRGYAGPDEAGRNLLVGAVVPWKSLERVMQERFRLGRCYFIPAGEFNWEKDFEGSMYVPSYPEQMGVDLGEAAWQPDDALIVPLELRGGEFVGVIWLDQPLDGRRPVLAAAQILEIFANQAAVAIENAELYDRVQRELAERIQLEAAQRRYAERLYALFEISQAIVNAKSSQAIAEAALNRIRSLIPCQLGAVTLFDLEAESATILTTLGGSPGIGAMERRSVFDELGRDGLSTLQRGDVYLVDDVREYRHLPATLQALQQKHGLRAYVNVPLIATGSLIGALNLGSTQPHAFAPEHLTIAQEIAGLLAVAIQQAGLHEQLQQRARELTAINKATQAINSTLDLDAVLRLVITETQTLFEAEGASVLLRVDDELEFVAAAGPGSENLIGVRLPVTSGLAGWVMREGRPVLTGDTRNDPRFYAGVDQITGRSTQSLMAAPLIYGGIVEGVVEVINRHPESGHAAFTQQDLDTLQIMADSAAIAVTNARLHRAEREQHELAETLRQIGATLASTLDRGAVLDRILEQVSRVVPNDAVTILLIEGGQAHSVRWRGFDRFGVNNLANVALSLTEAPNLRAMIETGETYLLTDVQTEPNWIILPEYSWVRSHLGAPVLIRSEVVGFLNAFANRPGFFNQAHAERLRALADQAAIALDNANLYNAVNRHAAELEQRVRERTAELDRERQRLQAVLDSAGEGIQLLDTAGRLQYINPAMEQLTGYTADEVLGIRPHLTPGKLNTPAVIQDMTRCLDLGLAWQGELINYRKDGSSYDVAVTLTPVRNEQGELAGFVGVYRDISRLKEFDRLKDQFVTRIGHELRTPVANVKLYLELLERGKSERREQYMRILNNETIRLRKLVDGFLDISELDASTEPLRPVTADLNHLVADLIAGHQALAEERGLTIVYQPRTNLPKAIIDRMLIDKALINVLTNALDYTPREGQLTVSTFYRRDEERAWVLIRVQDTGPGVAPDEIPHIFERFYRGKASANFLVPGAGLGLSIAKTVLDKLGGRITVESPVGQGATFTIWLRAAEEALEAA